MPVDFKNNWLLTKKEQSQGFTLIELMVVVIIVGVLSAVAVPNYLGQIGKARETEAKTNLGTIARAQQAHHYEYQEFYNGSDLSLFGDVNIASRYYTFTGDTTANADRALHTAFADDPLGSKGRDFAVGVYFNASSYSQVICIADVIDTDGTTSSVTAQADGSCSSGTPIE